LAVLHDLFHDDLHAAYLHGSAVIGGLRAQSDIDFIAVIDSPITPTTRRRLLAALLKTSAPHPAPPGDRRSLELMVFVRGEVSSSCYPATAELIYGEWLRTAFEQGELSAPVKGPGNTLALAQARQHSHPLFGPNATEIVSEIPAQLVRRAMRDALPDLLQELPGDERNVLLTLARMWWTGATGDFVPKDTAATWATARMPERLAHTLAFARDAYLGTLKDDWKNRRIAARETADYLRQRVLEFV
jgi:streptomycin 3"-adenylyltransferase